MRGSLSKVTTSTRRSTSAESTMTADRPRSVVGDYVSSLVVGVGDCDSKNISMSADEASRLRTARAAQNECEGKTRDEVLDGLCKE